LYGRFRQDGLGAFCCVVNDIEERVCNDNTVLFVDGFKYTVYGGDGGWKEV
jgi:hypothetical protein